MKTNPQFRFATQTALALLLSALVVPATAQPQPSAAERAAALKATMAASQAVLKQYEWVETIVVSVKGEGKSHQMNRCYFGADGGVQKIPLTTPPPAEKKRGLRGKIIEPGKRARLNFRNYFKPGDNLSVELDLTSNRLVRMTVKSYLEKADDAVNLEARFASLADGTTYTDTVTLDAPAKNIRVKVDNSGYRKTGN